MPFPFSDDVVLLSGEDSFYIPIDLADAHRALYRLLRPEDLERFRAGSEANMVRYHRGLGAWLRHHWGFFRGSRLLTYLQGLGLFHPDDMSGLVLDTFWRSLHGLPLDVSEHVARAKDYWRAMQKRPAAAHATEPGSSG